MPYLLDIELCTWVMVNQMNLTELEVFNFLQVTATGRGFRPLQK